MLGFTTDMYLPAFAAMQQDLNTSAASISASLSLFLAGFALASCSRGPPSDRCGRKPVLLSGPAIFAPAVWDAVGAQRHPDAGAALSAGDWRLCRGHRQAMVADYYPAQRTNRIFATIMPRW